MITTVKFWDDKKGWGFLVGVPESQSADIFIHHNNVLGRGHKTLSAGTRVTFDLVHTEKGYAAKNVLPSLT